MNFCDPNYLSLSRWCVSGNWLADGEQSAMDHVFEHIGVTWPIGERKKILRIASITAFPPHQRSEVWKGYDQTRSTAENVFYYPITASLTDPPSAWFHNLRYSRSGRS